MSYLKASPILLLIGLVILIAPKFEGVGPSPVRDDVLSKAYAADRVSQIAVLRELAQQPFDGATDEGRRQAGEFYNERRFRNRGADYAVFTDALADAINENKVKEFADKLDAK